MKVRLGKVPTIAVTKVSIHAPVKVRLTLSSDGVDLIVSIHAPVKVRQDTQEVKYV